MVSSVKTQRTCVHTHSSVKASHPPRATSRNAWKAVAATEKAPLEHSLTPISLRVCLVPRPAAQTRRNCTIGVLRNNACRRGSGDAKRSRRQRLKLSAMLNSRKFFPGVVPRCNLITDNPRSSPSVCVQEAIAAIPVAYGWRMQSVDWSRRVRHRGSPF